MLADGCFDPLHVGHVLYLQEAAAFGPLVVNVAPDAAIRAKGREPFQTAAERARTVLAIKGVEFVSVGSLMDALNVYRPEVLVKGPDWRGRLPSDVEAACQRYRVQVVYGTVNEPRSTERLTHD